MVQGIRIKMMEKDIELDSPDNMLAKNSVKSALLLPDDAVVSLSYKVDDRQKFCRMNETGTTFFLPDGWRDLQFFVDSVRAPS
ncbi:unnamed protein product [Caenorhabditis bovis]|uniref:TAR DNA-binding protein 43 N-terminal domain-containing protein n=1 Tax=Caenorhabditis bovis TaxID=2654633 RepID=A0A8S1F8C0_9PELO|nr:unnamed protein product [Caenorhabditis bovis]